MSTSQLIPICFSGITLLVRNFYNHVIVWRYAGSLVTTDAIVIGITQGVVSKTIIQIIADAVGGDFAIADSIIT